MNSVFYALEFIPDHVYGFQKLRKLFVSSNGGQVWSLSRTASLNLHVGGATNLNGFPSIHLRFRLPSRDQDLLRDNDTGALEQKGNIARMGGYCVAIMDGLVEDSIWTEMKYPEGRPKAM
ncbi:hypothetical protein NPIL_667941 [Nephila pilipes]|uniref:Uncharacterized protein n=1 Tax=Nephila pilipes TaxID=299642 RepID=A0A8X6NCR9_NEPPI|nr:hypothetical protein NPIL_667941 [Nephila pilipes]